MTFREFRADSYRNTSNHPSGSKEGIAGMGGIGVVVKRTLAVKVGRLCYTAALDADYFEG